MRLVRAVDFIYVPGLGDGEGARVSVSCDFDAYELGDRLYAQFPNLDLLGILTFDAHVQIGAGRVVPNEDIVGEDPNDDARVAMHIYVGFCGRRLEAN
eukprot:scaffold8014_cov125-Isochrysis_galbana.AAC.2